MGGSIWGEIITPSQKYRKKKKAAQRNHIEGTFGQGKRGYGLNNIKARLSETSESWINGYSGSFYATDFGVVCATDFGPNCATG
jgi:hypothetical protein